MTKTRVIALIGPESTGKSTLAAKLGQQLPAHIVDEYAREYLQDIGLNWTYEDVLKIAATQRDKELAAIASGHPIIILDTELITIEVWLEFYGMIVPNWIQDHIRQTNYEYYLLDTNLPWTDDGMRSNKNDRQKLLSLFEETLQKYTYSWIVVNELDRINNII